MLREVVTRAGRQRLAPDITARPVYYPRGPVITTGNSRVPAHVIPTDEELMIARHTRRLIADS